MAHQCYWLERVNACEISGESAVAYALEHGLPVRVLHDAKKTFVRKVVSEQPHRARFERAQTDVVQIRIGWTSTRFVDRLLLSDRLSNHLVIGKRPKQVRLGAIIVSI